MKDVREKTLLKYIQKALIFGVSLSLLSMLFGIVFKQSWLLSVGVLILIMTPVIRILLLSVGFYILGEFLFALAAFSVLVLMFTALLI